MDEIIIIFALILLNGIFSMSEIALISARKSSLQTDADKGQKSAKTALKLASDPDKFLSAVQIGITLIGILTGIFSGNKIAEEFTRVLGNAGMSLGAASAVAQTIIVIIVTYFTILLGELVPKRIAMSASEKVAKIVAGPMKTISVLTSPFVWMLAKSTACVLKILGVKAQESKVTEEEIKSIIQEGTDEGEVSPVEQDIVDRVFALGDLKVSTIMTLRNDIVFLDLEMTESEIRHTIRPLNAGTIITPVEASSPAAAMISRMVVSNSALTLGSSARIKPPKPAQIAETFMLRPFRARLISSTRPARLFPPGSNPATPRFSI